MKTKKTFTFLCTKPTKTLNKKEYTGTLKKQAKNSLGDMTCKVDTNDLTKASCFCVTNKWGDKVNVSISRFNTDVRSS